MPSAGHVLHHCYAPIFLFYLVICALQMFFDDDDDVVVLPMDDTFLLDMVLRHCLGEHHKKHLLFSHVIKFYQM